MAEAMLWNELKAKKLGGYKFVRQMPIGPYFADFACRSGKLVVELDGSQHAESACDRRRDEFMRGAGFSVLRFWSSDALKHTTSVCETILAALDGRLSEMSLRPICDLSSQAQVRGRRPMIAPSPPRFARHLSPALRGRGTQVLP